MTEDNITNDNLLSVNTPWGNLTKTKGVQKLFDSMTQEIVSLSKKVRDLERNKPSQSETNSTADNKNISDLANQINQIDKRLKELENKFAKFSEKTITILNKINKDT